MKLLKLLFCSVGLAILMPLTASAQMPGGQPGYFHALGDLREARFYLEGQPGDPRGYAAEDRALAEIDAAIRDIRHAVRDDPRDPRERPPVDIPEHGGRLMKSMEALRAAQDDIADEDDPEGRELRRHAMEHIDRAMRAVGDAHDEWMHDRGPGPDFRR